MDHAAAVDSAVPVSGDTPLHLLAAGGPQDEWRGRLARRLLDAGANTDAQNSELRWMDGELRAKGGGGGRFWTPGAKANGQNSELKRAGKSEYIADFSEESVRRSKFKLMSI